MTDAVSYYDLLNDSRWKRKRQRILKRDGFQCTACGSRLDLKVHHTYYFKNTAPWSYPDDSLITLCGSCHYDFHIHHEVEILDRPIFKKYKHKKKSSIPKKKSRKTPPKERKFKTRWHHDKGIKQADGRYRKRVNGEWVVLKK